MQKEPKTYVGTVRLRLKDMARLAMFYDKHDKYLKTISKLASEVLINSAAIIKAEFPVADTTDAIEILKNLGYDPVKKSAKNYRTLMKELKLESQVKTQQEISNKIAEQLTKEFKPENAITDEELKNMRSEMETQDAKTK